MTKLRFSRRAGIVALLAAGTGVWLSASVTDAAAQQRSRQQRPAAAPAQTAPAQTGSALNPDTQARQAIVVDFKSGAVLFEKSADERMHPSSMSKTMTAY